MKSFLINIFCVKDFVSNHYSSLWYSSCVINRIVYSELVIIGHKPWQGGWRPQQDYPCIVNMSTCRGLCSCQYVFSSDCKQYSLGASSASAALHHGKKQTGVLFHGLTRIICLPSGISSKLSAECWWCNSALITLWYSMAELCFRFCLRLILHHW